MSQKERVKCYYLHCNRNRLNSPDTSMFTLPGDSERCKLWLTSMGRLDLLTKPTSTLHTNVRVCADHFEEKYFTSTLRTRLLRSAEPVPISIATEITAESTTQETDDVQCGEVEMQASSSSACDTQNTVELTPKRRKIRSLRVQLHRLRARAQKTAQQTMKLKDAMRTIRQAVPEPLYELVRNCVSNSGRVRHWSPEIKSKALNIYLQSPAAYRLIRKLLNFPSKPTLLHALKTYATDVGFNEKLFEILRGACAKMNDTDKLCCLMWDEMSLKVNLDYNRNEDIVDGFERFSANSSGKIANQALVFMVRGICSNYKQALGYFFANQCTPGEQLVELIRQAVVKLSDIGLNVVATVCDQGGNNQKAYKLLGVSRDEPYFCVNNSTIFAFYDTPHLLKSTRNMFKKYNAHFDSSKVAEWKHIEQMYEIDKVSRFHLTKLTDKEVYVTGFQVMRVRTAARALSHSVAAAIYCLSSFGKLPAAAVYTAEFIANIDKVFDSLNGRTMTSNNKPLCGAVREGSGHHQIWEEMASFFRNIKYVNNENRIVYTPSTNGWLQNLIAAKLLWQVVKEKGVHSLLMGRINQDCLENTFCTIRNRGGNRNNPSCGDFRYTFRAIAAQSMLKCSDKGNCEIDYDNVLASVSATPAASTSSSIYTNSANKIDPIIEGSCNFSDLDSEIVNKNAMYYVAGYLAKKVNKKQQHCSHCCTGIIDHEKKLPDSVTFLMFKQYEQVTNGLEYPTTAFTQCVEEMAYIFDTNFESFVSQNAVTKSFENAMQQVNFNFLSPLCTNNCRSYIISLFTRMMLHARLRKVNADLASDTVSKKRKLQKVLHQ